MIAQACGFVAEKLTAAGIPTTHDPRDLNLPGAWVTPGEIDLNRLGKGAGDYEVVIALIAPDAGGLSTLTMLDDLLAKAITAGVGLTTVEPGTVQLENLAPGSLPALIATVTIEMS
ncbi:hypothetical protein AUC47_04905 [Microbacterium sp. SZ1]|uniref:hypothetical protein n=1 Tax=Microbacterium sp. SZ1 TaxID=1849736 RepID=UPI000BBBACC5|nr:hypothetical protein [Microbacterium sp. SZ1]PCE13990.1 hypothetical protein AUC47_04905 [Microbacterium sp. SZ1]